METDFLLRHRSQTVYAVHPASYPMGTECRFLYSKAPRQLRLSLISV